MRTTLENKHNTMLSSINNIDIEACSKELLELKETLNEKINWNERFDIEDRIEVLEDRIRNFESKSKSNDYYLNVMPILREYSEIDKVKDEVEEAAEMCDLFSKSYHDNRKVNKGQLYKEFIGVVENQVIDEVEEKETYICKTCSIPLLMSQLEALMICPRCGEAETYFDMSVQGMTYEQEITSEVNMSFSYKRINHFNEWLAQFQAKESTDIPKELLDKLMNEFKKERISDAKQITTTKVKQYLKKLNFNKYYEHTTHITNLLNGIKPPTMNPMLEERLRNMFRQIQAPFEKHKPKDRSNFLSYSYCLYKFCELLGEDGFKEFFPLLKSREKLYQQDCIWKNICKELNWEFIQTI